MKYLLIFLFSFFFQTWVVSQDLPNLKLVEDSDWGWLFSNEDLDILESEESFFEERRLSAEDLSDSKYQNLLEDKNLEKSAQETARDPNFFFFNDPRLEKKQERLKVRKSYPSYARSIFRSTIEKTVLQRLKEGKEPTSKKSN